MTQPKFTPGDILREQIENALYSTGKFLTDECSDLYEVLKTSPMIAAAPEMYRLLSSLVREIQVLDSHIQDNAVTGVPQLVEKINKLLARARGETETDECLDRQCEDCNAITRHRQVLYNDDNPELGNIWQCTRCFEFTAIV